MPVHVRILFMTLSWVMTALAFPAGPAPWMALGALVPFGAAIQAARPRHAFLLGWGWGLASWCTAVWWLAPTLELFGHMPAHGSWPLTVLFCAWAGLPYGLFAWLSARLRWLASPWGPLAAAGAFTVAAVLFPNVFPGNLAHSLWVYPWAVQTLDLGGVPLVLFLLALVNFMAASILVRRAQGRTVLAQGAALLLVLVLVPSYGFWRLAGLHGEMRAACPQRFFSVAAIQPDVPVPGQPHLYPPSDLAGDYATTPLDMSRHLLDQADPDLVVWPELPVNPSCGPESDFMDSVAGLAGKSRTPFLVNCMHYLEPGQGYYNAAQWVRADGFPGPRHKKKILLPLGEYLPLAETFPWLRRLFPEARRYRPGEGLVVMEADDRVRVAALLCYEAVFARTVRDHVRRGANLLVNMTDDAWFGDSDASTIHLALASFRAVEHRVPLVRVTNSGVGAHIRATGEVVPGSLTGLFTRATRTQEMYVPEHRAPYTRLGDSFLWLLVVYTGADILLRLDLTRRRRNGVPF